MITDHRLQIHLPDSSYKTLKEKAHLEGKSLGAVVREAVAAYVTKTDKERIREGYKMFDALIGHGPDDGIIASEEHDRIIDEAMEEEFLRKMGRLPKT